MPTGIVPATSDLVFRVHTDPLDTVLLNDGRLVESSTTVTIPRFSSDAAYSVPLPTISSQAPMALRLRRLSFECLSGCANIAMTSVGFWGDDAGITSELNAAQFDAALPPSPLSINLERADLFSGVIEFPTGEAANGLETFDVSILGSQFTPATFTQQIQTVEGEGRFAFNLGVPADETGGGWFLRVNCSSCDSNLIEGPFFATTAQGSPLSGESADQFLFLKSNNYTNLRLSILKEVESMFIPSIVPLLLDD